MGLLKSLRARFSSHRARKDNGDVGVIPSLSNEPRPENFISRNGSIARKSLPARARVEPHILNDAGPATPPKDDVPGSTIRLVGNGAQDNDTFQSQTRFPKAHATDNGKRGSTKLDPRTYWGSNPPLDPIDNVAEEHNYHGNHPDRSAEVPSTNRGDTVTELPSRNQGDTVAGLPSNSADMNTERLIDSDDQISPAHTNGELSSNATGRSLEDAFHADHHPKHTATSAELSSNAASPNLENGVNTDHSSDQADTSAELSAKAAGFNLEDSVDTDYHTTHVPAVTHETIRYKNTEIVQESVTREIHNHDYYHRIQPILDVEVLPERHFMKDIHGSLFEIPAPSGREILQPVVGEKYVDQIH